MNFIKSKLFDLREWLAHVWRAILRVLGINQPPPPDYVEGYNDGSAGERRQRFRSITYAMGHADGEQDQVKPQ